MFVKEFRKRNEEGKGRKIIHSGSTPFAVMLAAPG